MRYRAVISYDGSSYAGYQKQPKKTTVQGTIEKLFKDKFKQDVTIHASGRTDAGVHAIGQVIHFDFDLVIEDEKFFNAINNQLPKDIRFLEMEEVDEDFHARFDAVKKTYCYKISLAEYNLFKRNYQLFYNGDIDTTKLNEIAEKLIGTHDFQSFASEEKENSVREIESIYVEPIGGHWEYPDRLNIYFTGSGFLNHMVRHLVGAMLAFSEDKINLEYIDDLLKNPSVGKNKYKAPSHGLFLMNVDYHK